MADEQKPGEMPTQPPAGETPTGQSTTPPPDELAAKLADAEKRIRELNRESADRRKKLEAFEQAEAERKSAEMTEAQKLQARLDKLEAEKTAAIGKANAALVRAAVIAKASPRFHDAEDVYMALKDKLTPNDAGEVEGLDEALAELEKAKPHWVKSDKPAAPKLAATAPGQNATAPGETDAERRARIYGGGGNIFSADQALKLGGGVVVTSKQ